MQLESDYIETFSRTLGAMILCAIPAGHDGVWDRIVVKAVREPDAEPALTVTAWCQHATKDDLPHALPLDATALFRRLHAQMALDAQDWKRAEFVLTSNRKFEMDFEY
jgi:hypothetical protein